MSFVIVFFDCFVCHRDEVYTRRKLALGYMDLTDLEGKTIQDMLQRIPAFQALSPDVQERICAPKFINGMKWQVEQCSTVCTKRQTPTLSIPHTHTRTHTLITGNRHMDQLTQMDAAQSLCASQDRHLDGPNNVG